MGLRLRDGGRPRARLQGLRRYACLEARNAPSRQFRMSDIEAHRHRYRSPVAAIVGLAESALLREDLDAELLKQLQAIRALAQEALAADDAREGATEEARNSPLG